MPDLAVDSTHLQRLRSRAAAQLGAAAAGAANGPADALSVLHALASSPGRAADALALLHELQVHQVELELQAQELRESRAEMESALHRQLALYDALPVGCFSLDRQFVIRELNPAGARLLGLDRDTARGLRLDTWLSAAGADRLHTLAAMAARGEAAPAAALPLRKAGATSPSLQGQLALDPTGDGFVLVLASSGPAEPGDVRAPGLISPAG